MVRRQPLERAHVHSFGFPAKIGGGPVEIDGVAFVLPIFTPAPVALSEDHPVRFGAHVDGRDHLALA